MFTRGVVLLILMFFAGFAAAAADTDTKWEDRAKAAFESQFADNADKLAKSILAFTHPSGGSPEISTHTADFDGSIITAVITFTWKGALTGDIYSTTITWKFDKTQHISAVVSNDTAKIKVDEEHKKKLDRWFKESMFPIVAK